jgi:hypothetical protein
MGYRKSRKNSIAWSVNRIEFKKPITDYASWLTNSIAYWY